jgi:hypothetical protein
VERITRGNFRLLERLFPQITRVLKINQLETITDDVSGSSSKHLRYRQLATQSEHKKPPRKANIHS